MLLQNQICQIKISIDETYTVESSDNIFYNIVLNPHYFKKNDMYKTFSIKIDLFYKEICVALIGSFYSYDTDCALLDNEILTILQNDAIVQINIIDGSLILYKEFDCFGCNYGIYKVKSDYIIYGEIEIIMLDSKFNKKWTFSGRDIFVSMSKKKSFELCEQSIKLYDFEDNFYEVDFGGKLIRET